MSSTRNADKHRSHIENVSSGELEEICSDNITSLRSTAKRFKDFINASAFLDVKPNEDVMDILGFLAFEMVRTLCMAGLHLRNQAAGITKADLERERLEAEKAFRERQEAERLENEERERERERQEKEIEEQRKQEEEKERLKREEEQKAALGLSEKPGSTADGTPGSPMDITTAEDQGGVKKEGTTGSPVKPDSSADAVTKPTVDLSKPLLPPQASPKKPAKQTAAQKLTGIAALLPPPTASQAVPLLPAHILGAYATIQREQALTKNAGLRNFRGGAPRSRAKLL